MKRTLLPLLISPETNSPLELSVNKQKGEEIIAGELVDSAGNIFPIEHGIPRLLPRVLLAAQKSEMTARDAQVSDYDKMAFLRLFGQVEIPMTQRALGSGAEELRLEAGCGTGRMTQRLARMPGDLISIDFSFESLRVNQAKLQKAGFAHIPLVQADLCNLPFANESFDRIVSCQVLEHVPGAAARRQAVKSLARALKSEGILTLSAYQHSLFTRLFAEKEGEHAGGIPYFRFTRSELRALLRAEFQVKSITGALVYLYLASCRKA